MLFASPSSPFLFCFLSFFLALVFCSFHHFNQSAHFVVVVPPLPVPVTAAATKPNQHTRTGKMSIQAASFNFGAASRRDGCVFGSAGPGYSHPRLDTPRTPRGPPIQTSTIQDWLGFLKVCLSWRWPFIYFGICVHVSPDFVNQNAIRTFWLVQSNAASSS